MPDIRRVAFVALSSALLFGTLYSVTAHTYLDTSDPILALGAAAKHPLHDASYFARKTNVLNTLFIKRAWGWTSAAALALLITAPPPRFDIAASGLRRLGMTPRERIAKWAAATLVWLVFTSWFFGPAVLTRLTTLSGGECVVRLPTGALQALPLDYCYDHTIVSPATHPELFALPPSAELTSVDWRTRPKLMRGHDVSGHVFLLSMSLLFLADMVRPALALPSHMHSTAHTCALGATLALMALWVFAVLTTSVYFHTPFEKLTGYALGLAGFLFTQLPFFQEPDFNSTTRLHEA